MSTPDLAKYYNERAKDLKKEIEQHYKHKKPYEHDNQPRLQGALESAFRNLGGKEATFLSGLEEPSFELSGIKISPVAPGSKKVNIDLDFESTKKAQPVSRKIVIEGDDARMILIALEAIRNEKQEKLAQEKEKAQTKGFIPGFEKKVSVENKQETEPPSPTGPTAGSRLKSTRH